MIIAIEQNNNLLRIHLSMVDGSNHIIHDSKGNVLGKLELKGNNLSFECINDYYIAQNSERVYSVGVKDYSTIVLNRIDSKDSINIYFYPLVTPNTVEYEVKTNSITIGSDDSNSIVYSGSLMKPKQFKIDRQNNMWYLETIDGYVFVNDKLVKRKKIKHGDIIFSCGLKMFFIGNKIVLTNLLANTNVNIKPDVCVKVERIAQHVNPDSLDKEGEKEVFTQADEFQRSPRFYSEPETAIVNIIPPPVEQQQQLPPKILTLGPQMTMAITSCVTMGTSILSSINSQGGFKSALPGIALSLVTMISSYLWPSVTNMYNKFEQRKNKAKRIKQYEAYLENKEKEINEIIEAQKQILIENNVSLETCQDIIYGRKRNLWEKSINDGDFLNIRIGTGFVAPRIQIDFSEAQFSTDDTILSKKAIALINKMKYIPDMPLYTSFVDNRISAVIGNPGLLNNFFESLLLQLMTFHIYSELKIVIFTNERKISDWNYMKFSPYCWDNSHSMRFIAATNEEKQRLSQFIENEVKGRLESLGDNIPEQPYKMFKPYYLIITDDIEENRYLGGINSVLETGLNLGFSLIIKHNRIANLPSQCSTFLHITEDMSGLFKNYLSSSNQSQFKADFNKTINIEECIKELSNIYVKIPLDKHELPKSVGFLEMYGVGNVQQLNSLDRWQSNNPVNSLSVPVGIDQSGQLFNMDIHEKAYGPHGLVAGTTGSGKSEWIITYILSLCVNFSPEEVQFVLIDYKGGGLAGSFENKETGMHLPHLVGTITNLDKSEIRRSLISLEAESKKRQQMFNDAREKLNDSSMNIYKYQQYYRKGMLDEPLSHLFIISDEFAELKSQEPEFLTQLVSIARIGRSLGIHLILATQKPAGVVDEQMWSNSRFKVCLRVQDKADSNDMIKCPDAAFLKQTGAFYFQVGLNEFFGLGQSAYAGGKYTPTSIIKKNIDTNVELLDQSGSVINSVDYVKPVNTSEQFGDVHGEELLNIILYVSELSKSKDFKIRPLWLEAMQPNVTIDSLKKKYNVQKKPNVIEPIVGEYDDPYRQSQNVLQFNLNDGNIYIVGMSGSGKEQLLQGMIYSTITNYSPDEVALYILDLGAETLAMFEKAPQVGGVVFQDNIEMIENFFRLAKKEYAQRRNKYRDFGGTYEAYNKRAEKKDPVLTFIINKVDTLNEMLPDIVADHLSLFKDCAKYGITFILACVDRGIVKQKIIDTCENKYVLKQGDDDFVSTLGNAARGIRPKDIKGRGICTINDVAYEFQSAIVYDEEQLQDAVRKVCDKLAGYYKERVNPIPKIPTTINMDTLQDIEISNTNICVGYSKESIGPKCMNLVKNFGTVIVAAKKTMLFEYLKVLYSEFDKMSLNESTPAILFDSTDSFKLQGFENLVYIPSEKCVEVFKNLTEYVNAEFEKYSQLSDKSEYKAPDNSTMILHETSKFVEMYGMEFEELGEVLDKARELQLFNFVLADLAGDFRGLTRNKSIQKMLMDSNGVLIGGVEESAAGIEINSRDFRVKEGIPENYGFMVERGKATYGQMLQYTKEETEDENEV